MKAKQSFSLGRVALLARKHYAENRTNYLVGFGGYLLFLVLALQGAFRDTLPSLDRFDVVIIFAAFFLSAILTKMNFTPYIYPNRQVEAYSLPATRGEKFLFAIVNTFVVTLVAIVGLEVAASLVAPRCNEFIYSHTISGHWFTELTEVFVLMPMFISTVIFACTASRKGNFGVSLILTWGVIALLYCIPSLLLCNGNGTSVATMDFPAYIVTFNNHFEVGSTILECTTEQMCQPHWWYCFFTPAVLIVAAWFKFKEHETK